MNCPNCGKFYFDDYDFCPYCGEKKPDLNICPKCWTEYELEYSFCPKCGVELITHEELSIREEEEAIRIVEENRKNWKINQLIQKYNENSEIDNEINDGINDGINDRINDEIDKIELQINRKLEEQHIKLNKQLSIIPDEIDKIEFLEKLPSIENKLNAICINPGSNPCLFVRELKKTEILEMIISEDELFLINRTNIFEVLNYFYYSCIGELDHGKYIEEEGDYEYPDMECDYDFNQITGSCILYASTFIDETEEDLSKFYPYYKNFKKRDEEERREYEEERIKELEKKVDKNELLDYVEDNADSYIKYLGIDGYYDLTTKIINGEIPNKKTFYEVEANIEKQRNEGNYKKLKELTAEEILEIKKKGLYCYVRKLHILAEGSSVNQPVREELMLLVSEGKLLTETAINAKKDELIKLKLRELKKRF